MLTMLNDELLLFYKVRSPKADGPRPQRSRDSHGVACVPRRQGGVRGARSTTSGYCAAWLCRRVWTDIPRAQLDVCMRRGSLRLTARQVGRSVQTWRGMLMRSNVRHLCALSLFTRLGHRCVMCCAVRLPMLALSCGRGRGGRCDSLAGHRHHVGGAGAAPARRVWLHQGAHFILLA